jgi:predicted NBD/HSP70 family sugar kinase
MEKLTKQSQSNVKDNNLRLILNTLIQNEPLSRADIVRSTQISKPTVSSLTDELIRRGIILEIGMGHSQGGRKPILLRFNSTLKYFVAFEMGRVGYRIAISDLKGTLLRKIDGEYPPEIGLRERLEMMKEGVLGLIEELSIDLKDILKIICIAPGVYVEKGQEMKWYPATEGDRPQGGNPFRESARGTTGDKESEDMKAYFQDIFHHEVIFDHSTKLSLLGEKMVGKARGYRNVLYIDFAYGLGCSFMINGNVYFGSNNSAGEIGYFYSSLDEFKSFTIVPYELGALELNMSGFSLRKKAVEAIEGHEQCRINDLVQGDKSRITAKIVFKAAMEGDRIAGNLLKESFSYFNMALCNVINMLTPEVVILGGGFSNAGDFLLKLIEDEIGNKVLMMPKLLISDLKNNASIIGGVHYLIYRTDFLNEL